MTVAAEGVDPRDVSWEVEDPAYRVYFHGPAGRADEWRVTDARSVNEVVAWANERADGRSYVLYVEVKTAETGLVRLDGFDPNGG
ncbi:hypothetical protein LLS1_01590 [Leifsonia sp. LS1]|nr:hypothetical protein LLS1_01590 [Leifsonia sp. LS1]